MELNTPAGTAQRGMIDVRAIVAVVRRHFLLFVGVAALVMAAVTVYTLTRTPMYKATAIVLVQPQQTSVLKDQEPSQDTSSAAVDTEVQVLNSNRLAERIVLAERLVDDPEFNPGAKRKGERPDPRAVDKTVDEVKSRLDAHRSGTTFAIEVSFKSNDPAKAAKLANVAVQEYIASQLEAKYSVAKNANDWIGTRLQDLAKEVQANEAAVQQYKIAHNLMSAQGATMAEQEVSALNQQIAIARAEQAEKQGRLAAARGQLSRGGGGGDVAAALGSEVVRDLRRQRAEISRRQAELESRYGPLHPEVVKVERELADTDRQIQEEITRIVSNLQAEDEVARQRVASLEASRGGSQASLGSNSRALVTLNELERKAEASRAIYEAFLGRSKETAAEEGLQRADARLSSPAQQPSRPSSPNKPLNLAIGLMLALGAGAASVVAAEGLNTSLRTSQEVMERLGLPTITSVPLLPKNARSSPLTYVTDKPFTSFAESMRNIRAFLALADQESPKTIVLTSALSGEGKTLTSISFARSSAQSGAKVLLIDLDVRRRSLSEALSTDDSPGLLEVLNGEIGIEAAIKPDPISGASLLLLSARPPPTTDLFASERFMELLDWVRDRYDIAILDTAPVLAIAETRLIAARADVTVFITRWSKTPAQAAQAGIQLLLDSGARVAGVCLTQVDLDDQVRSGYGDNQYYYKDVQKYYQE